MLLAALTLVLGAAVPAVAQTDDPDAYADAYQAGDYGRVRFEEGGASILRADGTTDTGDRAGVNAPIFPGDTLRTDGNGRGEVQLANGTLLRLDHDSELLFQALPEPGAKYQDNSVLVLSNGVLRVASRVNGKEEFRVDSRDASVYLLGDGDVRIDANARGGTRVTSFRGVAEVVGNDSSVLVRGGTGTTVIAGSAPNEPQPASAFAADGFDQWCASRDGAYRTAPDVASGDYDRSQVPSEVRPYYNELSAYGSWTTVPTYGQVWCPRGVGADWRPYNSGYWAYGPGGYFWVSSEPWGWAPYHYGNWQWVGGTGWCWIPGSVFAGAWVSWSWGSLYVGWSPLDYWGRPGWVGGAYYGGYYDPGCWTFVNYNNIAATNVHRYAVPVGGVGNDLHHATVVSRPPRVDPRRLATSREVREKAFQQAAADQSARMRPLSENELRTRPTRTMRDIQTQLSRRPVARPLSPRESIRPQVPGNASAARTIPWNDPRPQRDLNWQRPRRILEDPRAGSDQRHAPTGPPDGVRDLYQRMSRPRETRPQEVAPSTPRRNYFGPTPQSPREQQQQVAPGTQRRSYFGPAPQAPREQQQPARVEPQRPQGGGPRAVAPPPPRPQQAPPRPQPQSRGQGGQGQARQNPDHGHGNKH
jgi:hypothetical protein